MIGVFFLNQLKNGAKYIIYSIENKKIINIMVYILILIGIALIIAVIVCYVCNQIKQIREYVTLGNRFVSEIEHWLGLNSWAKRAYVLSHMDEFQVKQLKDFTSFSDVVSYKQSLEKLFSSFVSAAKSVGANVEDFNLPYDDIYTTIKKGDDRYVRV